ncbi:MAG: hypothetical protein ACPG31_06365 [Planctomycetota bacterium]
MRQLLLLPALALPVFPSCAAPPPAASLRQDLQTREISAEKLVVYRSCLGALQDAGYVIQSADYEAGFITAFGEPAPPDGLWQTLTAPDRMFASVVVEPKSTQRTEVRITFVEHDEETDCEGRHSLDTRTTYAPQVYGSFFQNLDRALLMRREGSE